MTCRSDQPPLPTETFDPKAVDMPHRIIRERFGISQGQLLIDNNPVSEIVSKFGTPLYVYGESILEEKWSSIRSALPPEFQVYYSMKANPLQEILRFFVRHGCGLEIASGGELAQALAAGCSGEQILFAGPGKTDAELQAALRAAVGEIHVESLNEIQRLAKLASEQAQTVRIALRVNPQSSADGGAMRMGGRAAPFGIDEEDLEQALTMAMSLKSLIVTGIHLFAGTQILDASVLLKQYRHAISIAGRVSDQLQRPLETIDFGGGWGVPYFVQESPLAMDPLRQGLSELNLEIQRDPRLSKSRLIIEPGRFLTAEAGIYLTQVIDVKTSRGTNYVITNGGMHHHLAASGNLGQVIKRNFPIAVVNRLGEPTSQTVDLVGPLCTPLDTLGRNVNLPRVQIGDIVGIFQSGAYARSASPLGFLSHPSPAEVYVSSGVARLARRRGPSETYLADQESTR